MCKKSNTQDFIEKSQKIHRNKYDYSLVDYINNKIKVKIICPIHGIFEQQPVAHMRGQNCRFCVHDGYSNGLSNFIMAAKKIHGDEYDYSLVDYINNKTKVKIICLKHGIFEQRPDNHLHSNQHCPICNKITTTDFITAAKIIHGDKYDYSLTEYSIASKKIKIICPEHGLFEQMPYSHLRNVGCPRCRCSKGEIKIAKLLKEINIKYEPQKRFDGCKDKKLLPFDFYLPEYKTCIEFDGEQHYKSVKYWGGDKGLELTQKRDRIKNLYCEEQQINLIRIKYNEDIEQIINTLFT